MKLPDLIGVDLANLMLEADSSLNVHQTVAKFSGYPVTAEDVGGTTIASLQDIIFNTQVRVGLMAPEELDLLLDTC
jgi:hypothetical protein